MLKRAMFTGLAVLALATTTGCYGLCGSWYPGKYMGQLFACNGCSGPVYWSNFHNDPPDIQDPCDCQGNFTGQRRPWRSSRGNEVYYEDVPHQLEAPPEAVPTPVPEKPKKTAARVHSHGTQPVRYVVVDR